MAGRGPAPKAPEDRVRRNADTVPTTEVVADGALHGPSLPARPLFIIGHGEDAEAIREWPDETLAWWDTWRRSPQAAAFSDTDWSFLIDTARLHGEFWYGETRHAAELRLRVAKFGATLEDRLRLRLSVTTPEPSPARSKPGDDEVAQKRRDRLAQAAGE